MSPTGKPTVAVVVLNYNGMRFLKDCFESLFKSTYQNAEYILLDNCSTDRSIEFVKENFPGTKIIQTGFNGGFSQAYNKAASMITSKYMVLLNNDVKVYPGWLEPMVETCEGDSSIGAVAPKLVSMHDPGMFEYAGASGGFLDKYGYPFARGRIFFTLEKDHGQYEDTADILWATGASLFIRRDVFVETGGLDQDFVHHMEEIDLCWRINLAGYKIKIVPQSVVVHFGGATIIPDSFKKTYWNHRNSIFMLYKNLEKKNLWPQLCRHIFLDVLAVFWYLSKLQIHKVWAVFRALFWILTHFNLLIKNRKQVLTVRKKSDLELSHLIYPRSVAFRYFLFKEETFSQLAENWKSGTFKRNRK